MTAVDRAQDRSVAPGPDAPPRGDHRPVAVAVADARERLRLTSALLATGHRVWVASTGAELLALGAGGQIGAAVVEADLPDVSGLFAALQLAHLQPEVPILLLCDPDGPTSWADGRDRAAVLVRPAHPALVVTHLALLLSTK